MRQLDTHVAYYTSADPWDWHAKVPAWSGVRYREPYPGVGWELSGAGGQLSSRLIARQATDLWPVRMRVQGADGVALAEDSLSLTTVLGTFALPLPLAQAADVAALPFAGMAPSLQGSDVAHPFGGANPAGSSAGGAPQAINGLEYSRLFGGNGTYVAKFQIGTPVAPTYTISGHIRTPAPNSSPVAGVTVTAGSRSTITDSDGMYRLVDLPPTQYTVRPSKAGATFAPEFQTLNLSLSLVTHSIPPKTWCDPFEPNNSLSLISPIVLGQEVKARICEDEGAPAGPDSKYRDDFYVVSVTRSAPLNIRVTLPDKLWGQVALKVVQGRARAPQVPNCYVSTIPKPATPPYVMKCNIPAADDYTIWLYSSEGVVDNDHDYTLVITQ